MRSLDEKEFAVLALLAANPNFKSKALGFLSKNPAALAIAGVLTGDHSDDPAVMEAADTIRGWAQQQRRSPVPA